MSREAHVQFCERLGVRLPGATHRNIYVRSQRAGQRVMHSVTGFLTRRRKRKVNEAKSAVARPVEGKFLGFSFSNNKEPKRRIAPKVLLRCQQKIREHTRRTRGISLEPMLKELTAYLRGWKSYFGFAQTTLTATATGSMDTSSSAVHDLEAVETRSAAVREASSSRGRCGSRRPNGGQSTRPLASGEQPGPVLRASHRLLRFAGSPSPIRWRCLTL